MKRDLLAVRRRSGEKSSAGSVVSCSGSPPASDSRKMSALPVRSESYSNHFPSGETLIASIDWLALITGVAPAVVTGGAAGIGSDQMLVLLAYREYASRDPLAAREIVWAPRPVLRRMRPPPALPSAATGRP